MPLSIGIVGLPNVGKSTLFTALTRKRNVSANYPFTTIDPATGVVAVPDRRLDRIVALSPPEKVTPAAVEFVDIAGLVKGASQGEGLGNQFLANIRETTAICEVVRYFADPDVVHVSGEVDPIDDVEIIRMELVLADLATVERARPRLEKEAKRDPDAGRTLEAVRRVEVWLGEGHRAGRMALTPDERLRLGGLHLLTMKPMLYVANVDEDRLHDELPPVDGVSPIRICAKVEAELAEMPPEEAAEYLEALGLAEPGLNTLIREAYRLLGLQSFFTHGDKEARAWTVRTGATAPEAAGVIHTDFQRGFIKAEVVSFDDYDRYNGEAGARAAGRLRIEGKDYVVQDGDVIHFRFNV